MQLAQSVIHSARVLRLEGGLLPKESQGLAFSSFPGETEANTFIIQVFSFEASADGTCRYTQNPVQPLLARLNGFNDPPWQPSSTT